MASPPYGYRSGPRNPQVFPVDSSSAAIEVGDQITEGTAGYVQQAAAGSNVLVGVAMEACAVPSADGAKSVLVDISEESVYEFPADTGTVTQALVTHYWDVGGAQSIDIDASTDDTFYCTGIDAAKNTVFGNVVTKLNAT